MPDISSDDLDQTNLALAALFAALVQILREGEGDVRQSALDALDRIYLHLRNLPTSAIGAMSTVQWARELIRKLPD